MKVKRNGNKMKKVLLACLALVAILIPITKKDSIVEVVSKLSEQEVDAYYSTITDYQKARWTEIQNAIFGNGVATSETDTNLLTAKVVAGNPYFNWVNTGLSKWNGGTSAVNSSGTQTINYSTTIENGSTASKSITYTVFNVSNGEQLRYVLTTYAASTANIKVNLTSDIDLNGNNYVWNYIDLTGVTPWLYIEGNGHTIYNLNSDSGLFSNTDKYFVVKNLNFVSVKLVGNKTSVGVLGYKGSGNMYVDYVHVKGAFVQNTSGLTSALFGTVNANNNFVRNSSTENCYIYSAGQHTGGFATIFDSNYAAGTSYDVAFPTTPEATFGFTNANLNQNDSAYPGTVDNCYSIDSEIFSTAGHSGGFISCSDGGIIVRNCFTNNTI